MVIHEYTEYLGYIGHLQKNAPRHICIDLHSSEWDQTHITLLGSSSFGSWWKSVLSSLCKNVLDTGNVRLNWLWSGTMTNVARPDDQQSLCFPKLKEFVKYAS